MNERIKLVRVSSVDESGKKLTQDKFADALGVSKNYVCQLETGLRTASDNLIKLICATYDVNEEWLRTGLGDMKRARSEDEELAAWIARIQFDSMSGERADIFKKRLLVALSHIKNDETWEDLYQVIQEIANGKTE